MTVAIRQTYPSDARPALGRECHFQLEGGPASGVEFFLEHEGILYPRPIPTDGATVRLYPEASGRYVLHAFWDGADGSRGRAQLPIEIAGPPPAREPRLAHIDDRTSLWVPTEWDRQAIEAHERPILKALQQLVRPGDVVYDIGANVGLFSVMMARWVGETGWLYAFEPNPVCMCFLRANLERARAERYTLVPVALSDRRGECAFTSNYATTLVGAGADSPATIPKPGHQIRVDADTLDAIIDRWQLRAPNVIKIDIEGAERVAIAGMMRTLERRRPTLLVELHGRDAAQQVLPRLAVLRYEFEVPAAGARFATADELLAWMPEACVQVAARAA